MKERPFFTAAFVFSSPSLVPSLAAFTSFCILEETKHTVIYITKVTQGQFIFFFYSQEFQSKEKFS